MKCLVSIPIYILYITTNTSIELFDFLIKTPFSWRSLFSARYILPTSSQHRHSRRWKLSKSGNNFKGYI